MDKKSPQYALAIFSRLFIVLGIIDIAGLIYDWTQGDFNPEFITYATGLSASMAKTAVIAVLILALAIAAMKFYMGISGLNRAKGTSTGTGHITVAKIAFVLMIIAVAITVLGIFQSTTKDWLSLITPICSLVILYEYIKSAKLVG